DDSREPINQCEPAGTAIVCGENADIGCDVKSIRQSRVDHDVVDRNIRKISTDVCPACTSSRRLEYMPLHVAKKSRKSGKGNVRNERIIRINGNLRDVAWR